MIPLQFNNLEKGQREKIVNDYYKKVTFKRDNAKIKKINDWCVTNLTIDGVNYNFQMVINAEYDELVKIKNYIDSNKISMKSFVRIGAKGNKICYIVDTLYKKMKTEVRSYIIKSLKVTSCPYCNRNYINSTKNLNTCHFDHFINKDDYPIFAISFYNLIPVCPSCNVIKGKKEFSYSPHNMSVSADEMLRFSYHLINMDYLQNIDSIKIDINVIDEIIRKNIDVIDLKNLYQIHGDVVQELLKKQIIYSTEYIDDLMREFQGLFDSKEEVYRILFSAYVNEGDYQKRTLSKLIKDILLELKLIDN